MSPQGSTTARRVKLVVKVSLTVLVLVAVGRQVQRSWADLGRRGSELRVEPGWLVLSGVLYLLGLIAYGTYYYRLNRASVAPVGWYAAQRAYLISHLGKYVPGKALVVVMRAGLTVPYSGRAVTAALASVYETLVMMAAGGLIAAAGFLAAPSRGVSIPLGPLGTLRAPLALLGLTAGLGFFILVETRVFARLSRLIRLPFPGVGPESWPRLTGGLLAEGMLWSAAGWVLLGASQVAVLRSIVPGGIGPEHWPVVTAAVALATVAGFAVPIAPGGLGVREWVLWTSLSAVLDRDLAVLSALLLRLSWLAAELIVAAILVPIRPATPIAEHVGEIVE